MEIVTGYFISRAPALETARDLQKKGFKIEVLGRGSQEDYTEKTDSPDLESNLNNPFFGVPAGPGFNSGINNFMFAGSGPIISPEPIVSIVNGDMGRDYREIMIEWGVPENIDEEIRNVIDSGSSAVLVECKSEDKSQVVDILNKQGAQNIHS